MKYLLIIISVAFTINSFGKDLETLIKELHELEFKNLKGIRKKTEKILKLDPLNETAILYLIRAYKCANHQDSAKIFFNKLKMKNPKSPIPYILSARYLYEELTLKDTLELDELRGAIKIDSNNFEANSTLGKSYYKLFNLNQTSYYADQCRKYLLKAIELDSTYQKFYKYSIIQTSHFLNDTNFISTYERKAFEIKTDSLNVPIDNEWYFPITSFFGDKKDWRTDYKVNILREIFSISFKMGWYSYILSVLEEPIIFNQNQKTIYRFTWIRSFHEPIIIRLEKTDNNYNLIWKESNGKGGYNAGKLETNSYKQLTIEQWENFINLLHATDFWNMPAELENEDGLDGAQWILEGLDNGKYHVVDRWSTRNKKYKECCIYLMKLTDLEIDDRDIY